MATVDGFVSQHDVVGHLKAGYMKKEKIVDDYGLGDFGSDDCSFLAILSEWIDVPEDDYVDVDQSKLILLKQHMKNKDNIQQCIDNIPLSIEVNEGIYMESINIASKKKKKRRRRRKKHKNVMIDKSILVVEPIDGVFIPSATPALEIEYQIGISIPSSSSLVNNSTGSVQQHQKDNNLSDCLDGCIVPDNLKHEKLELDSDMVHSLSSSADSNLTRQDYQEHQQADFKSNLVSPKHQQADLDSNIGNSLIKFNSQTIGGGDSREHTDDSPHVSNSSDNGYYSSISGVSTYSYPSSSSVSFVSHSSGSSIGSSTDSISNSNGMNTYTLQTLKNNVNDWNIRMLGKGGVDTLSRTPRDFYPIKMCLNEIIELSKIFDDQLNVLLKSLDNLNLIVLNWGGRKVFRLQRSRFKYKNIDEAFDKYYPFKALIAEFVDYYERYGNRVGVKLSSYNKLQVQYFGALNAISMRNDCSSVNSVTGESLLSYGSNDKIKNNNNIRKYHRKRGRKKRQYQMVYKNKLQNAQFKQFGHYYNGYHGNNYHNSVVLPKLVTARVLQYTKDSVLNNNNFLA